MVPIVFPDTEVRQGRRSRQGLRWPGVPPMFAFRDQDGNGLEIVEA